MFVKFSCGCIGVQSNNPKKTYIISICDIDMNDSNPLFTIRDMSGKTFEPVSNQEFEDLFLSIGKLVGDGHKFRTIQTLLGTPPIVWKG